MYEYEELKLGPNPRVATYYDCFACRRQLKIKLDWSAGFDYESATREAVRRGWSRRYFHASARPWFCSKECGYNSSQAKYCEMFWAVELKENDVSLFDKFKNWLFS